MNGYLIVLFDSARDVVRAEKLCSSAGMSVAVVPPPKMFSKDCGMSLRIGISDKRAFEELIRKNDINVTIYE